MQRVEEGARRLLPRLIVPKPMVAERQNIVIVVFVIVIQAAP
jgi:hypothetical protein